MISDWNRQKLNIDFGNIKVPSGRPSDIDFYYVGHDYIIFAEIKNEVGQLKKGQKRLYEELADNLKHKTVYVYYMTHNKFVEKGDLSVDVAECVIKEYYDADRRVWVVPETTKTFQEVLDEIYSFHEEK
jgi:hypothetical protein